MAMVKIAALLLVVFTAAALGNSQKVDSIHELHPDSSPAPSPSADSGEHKKTTIVCAIGCVTKCQDKQSWRKLFCIGLCLAECALGPTDSVSEVVCAVECAQSSINNLRYEEKMDDRVSACTKLCLKE